MQEQYITVSFCRFNDRFSKIIRKFTHNGFSHASISFDDNEYHSFTFKGFTIEKPKIKIPKTREKGICLVKIFVPNEKIDKLKELIETYIKTRNQYKYDKIGVVLSYMRIPHKFGKRYFCSQFVAKMLIESEIVKLRKKDYYYTPQRLFNELFSLNIPKQISISYF